MIAKNISSLIFFILICKIYSVGQDITAYTDNRGNLQVFDKGMFRQIEYLPPTNYKIGGTTIAYIDHKNDFKVYYNGQTISLVNAADFSYFVTDYLTAFKVGNVLYVFDEGEKKTLCYYTTILAVNDSILAFFDDSQSSLNIYYNGRVANAEDAYLSQPKSIKTGGNLIAWINQSGHFTVFYQGQTYQLDNIAPIAYEAGSDIVAYIDNYEQRFRLFYKGDTALVEEFIPDSFKVGFGIMAYVDNLGNFRMFSNGATKKVLSNRPDFFQVKGNVVVYSYNNSFNIIYNGKTTNLQNVTPFSFQLGNDGIAWLDDSGRLQLFHKGNIYTVSYEVINKYHLNGNVLKYEVGNNTVNIFYNGKNY
jgi:hypothetical protein